VIDKKLQSILDEMKITFTNDQVKAFNTIVHGGKHTLCCGRGGVGKSLLIDVLKRYLGNRVIVGSTTGISNQNLFNGKGGVGSMHKIFSLPTTIHNDYHIKKATPFTRAVLGSNHDLEYVIIDEAGFLLNSDLLALIKQRLLRFNKKYKDRPQRYIKLILIGDIAQLPPFFSRDGEEYMRQVYGSPYFFKSGVFSEMDFNIVGINQVMRTDDKVFKAALDVLRYDQKQRYDGVCKWLNSIMYKQIPEGLPSMVCTNEEAERLNMEMLDKNPNRLWNYSAIIKGNYNIKNCPSGEVVSLKEGAIIMTLINHIDGEYNNGSLGEVTMLTSDYIYVRMFHTGKEISIGRHIFEETEMYQSGTKTVDNVVKPVMSSKVIGECHAFPVRLAYILNIHKMQGRTVSSPMVVDLGAWGFNPNGSFGDSMAYVALSRFCDPKHVYLKHPIKPRHLRANKEILSWLKEYVNDEYML